MLNHRWTWKLYLNLKDLHLKFLSEGQVCTSGKNWKFQNWWPLPTETYSDTLDHWSNPSNHIAGLELGVGDCLSCPIFLRFHFLSFFKTYKMVLYRFMQWNLESLEFKCIFKRILNTYSKGQRQSFGYQRTLNAAWPASTFPRKCRACATATRVIINAHIALRDACHKFQACRKSSCETRLLPCSQYQKLMLFSHIFVLFWT